MIYHHINTTAKSAFLACHTLTKYIYKNLFYNTAAHLD